MPKKQIVMAENGQPTGVINFLFEDETTQTVDINSLTPEMQFRLAVHGASQKVGDSYAGAAKEASPVSFAKESVAETIKQLVDNLWRVTSPGGPRVTDLATAYALAVGETVENAVEFIGGLDEAAVKELRAKPRIKAHLAAIAARKAAERAAKALADADAADKQAA